MKLVEAKQLREDAVRAKLKEMYPDATEAQLDEAVPQAIAKGLGAGAQVLKKAGVAAAQGAKKAGQAAVAGAKKAAPVVKKAAQQAGAAVQKGAKQAGAAVKKGAKAVGQEAGKAYKGAKQIGKNVVTATDTMAKAAKAAAADGMSTQDQARAAMGSRLAGGKSAAKFAQGAKAIQQGKGITGQIASELGPHVTNLQLILADPMLRNKWKMLVKQAKQGRS
tara:strand:- start:45 stop:707 length:663 start_codon:yes stop_codon:yes gene_type:complete